MIKKNSDFKRFSLVLGLLWLTPSALFAADAVSQKEEVPQWLVALISFSLVAVVVFFSLRGGTKKTTKYQQKLQKRQDEKSEGLNWDNDEGIE